MTVRHPALMMREPAPPGVHGPGFAVMVSRIERQAMAGDGDGRQVGALPANRAGPATIGVHHHQP